MMKCMAKMFTLIVCGSLLLSWVVHFIGAELLLLSPVPCLHCLAMHLPVLSSLLAGSNLPFRGSVMLEHASMIADLFQVLGCYFKAN